MQTLFCLGALTGVPPRRFQVPPPLSHVANWVESTLNAGARPGQRVVVHVAGGTCAIRADPVAICMLCGEIATTARRHVPFAALLTQRQCCSHVYGTPTGVCAVPYLQNRSFCAPLSCRRKWGPFGNKCRPNGEVHLVGFGTPCTQPPRRGSFHSLHVCTRGCTTAAHCHAVRQWPGAGNGLFAVHRKRIGKA